MKRIENKDIPRHEPYDPLEKRNIGENIVKALLEKPLGSLPPSPFIGAGVYAIYHTGCDPLYGLLSDTKIPVYVGKAVPAGARKGNVSTNSTQGCALYNRLKQHADSIAAAGNLNLNDFRCRDLAVDDIWIPLAETLLIEKFQPVWNVIVEGFGNHDPGKGRHNQQRSAWDTLHPGRQWALRLQPSELDAGELLEKIKHFHTTIH